LNLFNQPSNRLICLLKGSFLTGLLTGLLSGCTAIPSAIQHSKQPSLVNLNHAYDYVLLNSEQKPITLPKLLKELNQADVIFIGEFHENHASHLLEMQLLSGLYQNNKNLVLSLEMFNRDQQSYLDDYVDGEIGEVYLTKEAPSWQNYTASYRPLVEFAKDRFLTIIAANASADIVRCVGRQGTDYINKLDSKEKQYIAAKPFAEIPGYQTKFYDFLEKVRKLSEERKQKSYLAQITRDNTMAESIYQAWLNNKNHQIVHINGTFHSAEHLGTVAALKRLNPDLHIKVITPVYLEDYLESSKEVSASQTVEEPDELYYVLNPQPVQFVDSAYKSKNRKAMFDKAANNTCKE